ncbi:MAG: V-type ATP synthase subunit D [Lachnospiraceae bacterium]|nr:V-type ATP synthase subunit D [Lachnospiraceae bacterium]
MDPNTFPTKGNLIAAKNSLALSRQGFELMNKKRNILIRELMELIDQARDIQGQIDTTFRRAYEALQKANIEMGISRVEEISYTVPEETSIRIKTRSIMGTEIPLVEADPTMVMPTYSYYGTRRSLDEAREAFEKVKELTIKLSMVENSAYRLATNIKKTQKRANALKNITIPHYETLVTDIGSALEEKEREEFTRLKVIKRMQGKG